MQNLFDKASLVMVPSGYDNGKLYNIKPEDKGSAFEFERATMATRVNSSGLIETMFSEATNLLLQSNQFDTTWTTSSATVTSGHTGYDGSNDAWLLNADSDGVRSIKQTISASGVLAFSFYAKAGTTNYVRVQVSSSTNGIAYFDLVNGTVGFKTSLVSQNIESVGNGWFRCSIVADKTITDARIYVAQDDSATVNEGDNIYIQDAQLESGHFATPYIETTTQTVTRQNQANQPRIDYSSGGGALLLEPGRTNLIPKSEDFSGWLQGGGVTSTVIANAYVSPEGLQNATSIQLGSGGYVYTNITQLPIVSGDKYVFSCFVNSSSRKISYGGATVNGTDVYSSQSVGNGWYRQTLTRTFTASGQTIQPMFREVIAGSDLFYIWGVQAEEGPYATSYIPTNGQQETRASENIEKRNLTSSLLNQSEGSFYLELQAVSTDAGRFVITSYPDGTSDDTIRFIFSSNIQFQLVSSGTQIVESTNPSTQRVKVIGTYSGSELKLCVNGGTVQKLSGNFSFANQPTRIFAHAFVDTIRFFGDVYGLHYFPEILTDEELQRLTSPSADATTFTELANNNGYTIL